MPYMRSRCSSRMLLPSLLRHSQDPSSVLRHQLALCVAPCGSLLPCENSQVSRTRMAGQVLTLAREDCLHFILTLGFQTSAQSRTQC